MSLAGDGRAALTAMLSHRERFARIKDADWSMAAIKLAKKQLIAAGQKANDLNAIKDILGADTFERTLDTLTAFQAKQLAKRIDPTVLPETIASCSMALTHIRGILSGDLSETRPVENAETPEPAEAAEKPKNKYLGRKAFRTGR